MNPAAPTVYVVDDDSSVRKGLRRLLVASGLNVETFDSPQAFLEQHDARMFGCLVLDLAMPGLNGMQLQQVLEQRGNVLPVIFLTGHGDIPLSVQAMQRGAVGFLTKPVDEQDLLAVIEKAFEGRR